MVVSVENSGSYAKTWYWFYGLTADELAIAGAYYDISEIGDMHHNAAKNVLHVKQPLEVVARKAHESLEAARTLLAKTDNMTRH